jgi:PAS domain S-box-containing protein
LLFLSLWSKVLNKTSSKLYMQDTKKTKSQLMEELKSLRRRLQRLEKDINLHDSEEWKNTFNTMRDLIFITDRKGIVRQANLSLADKLGVKPQALIGKPCWEIFKCGHLGTESCSLVKMQKGLSIRKHEVEIPFLGIWVIAHVYAVYTPSKELDYVIHTYRDITEHKRLEEQLLQLQKVDAVARLAGGVAHEFNNLLTGIIGNLGLAKSELSEESEGYLFIERANDSAIRAAALVNRLLAFASKLQVTCNLISVNDVLLKVVSVLRETIDPRIKIIVNIDKDIWPVVADPVQINNMLISLLINARDAIMECLEGLFKRECKEKESFIIAINAENTKIDEKYCGLYADARLGEFVLITVYDNGSGMDAETQRRIFDPFFTTRKVSKGKGLGLATVYGIVKQHNGWVNVYSELGDGTTFKVFLPRAEP